MPSRFGNADREPVTSQTSLPKIQGWVRPSLIHQNFLPERDATHPSPKSLGASQLCNPHPKSLSLRSTVYT